MSIDKGLMMRLGFPHLHIPSARGEECASRLPRRLSGSITSPCTSVRTCRCAAASAKPGASCSSSAQDESRS